MAENQEFDKAEREALYKLLPKIGADRDGDIIHIGCGVTRVSLYVDEKHDIVSRVYHPNDYIEP